LADSSCEICKLLMATRKPIEALRASEAAHAMFRKLADANPTVIGFRVGLAGCDNSTGNALRILGKTDEAMNSYESALAIYQELAAANPSITSIEAARAGTYFNIGILLTDTNHPTEALKAYRSALAIQKELASTIPTAMEFRAEVASIEGNIGQLLCNTGQLDDALELFQSALSIQRKLAIDYPDVLDHRRFLANTYDGISTVMAAKGKLAEAQEAQEAALAIRRKLALEHPQSPEILSELANSLNNLAANYTDSKQLREARESLRLAVASQRKAMELDPASPNFRRFLIDELNDLIKLSRALGDPQEAAEANRELRMVLDSAPAAVALDARLTAIIKGDQQPKDEADRLRLAQRAYDKALHATAARLWGEALAAVPKLGDDRQAQHRYNAACSAALAASGQGQEESAPDGAARAKLHGQALDWLKAELSAWERVAIAGGPDAKEVVARTLAHWKADADLAGIRDARELAELPSGERAALGQLWDDVDRLLAEVKGRE
jgi:tetratricopeptide (TPR) repeat protein